MDSFAVALSGILQRVLSRRGGPGWSLSATLNEVLLTRREAGCYYRPDDEAFAVRELGSFREFITELSTLVPTLGSFAILDYWLPDAGGYINAIYYDRSNDTTTIPAQAQRLTTLYRNSGVARLVFDTNKIMTVHSHYAPFVLTRSPQTSLASYADDYVVDLRELHRALPEELRISQQGLLRPTAAYSESEFLAALATHYEGFADHEGDQLLFSQAIAASCSPMVRSAFDGGNLRKVQGVEFLDTRAAFLTYSSFFLSIVPDGPVEFVYFPTLIDFTSGTELRWVGGILLPFDSEISSLQRSQLWRATSTLVASLSTAHSDGMLLATLERAARAQIISRNMSHNLGSHALARIDGDDLASAPRDADRLLAYLQQRMDFVARVSTSWPAWREPLFFVGDLLRGFFQQSLMLNNLIADDGFHGNQIEFQWFLPGSTEPSKAHFKEADAEEAPSTRHSEFAIVSRASSGTAPSDVLVSIPGGVVGRQAFYGFLENALRNAAKHNPRRLPLVVTLQLGDDMRKMESPSPYWRLRLQDSNSRLAENSETIERIRKELARPLVDSEARDIRQEGLGLQEMKAYAELLAHRLPLVPVAARSGASLQVLDASAQPLLGGAAQAASQDPGDNFLTYDLLLQRACLGYFVTQDTALQEACAAASAEVHARVSAVSAIDLDEIGALCPSLLAIDCSARDTADLLTFLARNEKRLPSRILLRPAPGLSPAELRKAVCNSRLGQRARVDSDQAALRLVQGDVGDATRGALVALEFYKRWLKAFSEERGFELPLNLLVYLERGGSARRRWEDLCDSLREGPLADFVRIFPIFRRLVNQTTDVDPEVVIAEPWHVIDLPSFEGSDVPFASDVELTPELAGGTWMAYHDHGKGVPSSLNPAFQQYIGRHAGAGRALGIPSNWDAFDRLYRVSPGGAGMLSLLQILEASLLRLLVVDERLLATLFELQDGDGPSQRLSWRTARDGSNPGSVLLEALRNARIEAPTFLEFEGTKALPICLLRASGPVQWGLENYSRPYLALRDSEVVRVGLWDFQSQVTEVQPTELLPTDNSPPFDFVVVHKGLLEWLETEVQRQGGHLDRSRFLRSLRGLGGRVVLTSGRGGLLPGEESSFPFLEYSVLESQLVRELTKPSLGNILMSLSGSGGQDL